MSQSSQPSSSPRLSLPLLKFSHATVAEGISAPIPWKHIVPNHDLFVVLDTVDTQGPAGATEKRQRFQVYHGPDVLVGAPILSATLLMEHQEDIDLDILAREAQKANMQAQIHHDNRGFPVITVIAKLPCLAMRYPLSGARVRRFQVRFAEPEGFYETMKRLSRTGVPMTEATQAPPVPAALQVYPTMNKDTNHGGACSDQRPSTATGYNCFGINHDARSCSGPIPENGTLRPATSGGIPSSQNTSSVGRDAWALGNPHQRDPTMIIHQCCLEQNTETPSALCADTTGQLSVLSVPSTIDLYTPRPQSGLITDQTKPKDVMPPKRELPFSKIKKSNHTVDSADKVAAAAQDVLVDTSVTRMTTETDERLPIMQDVTKTVDTKNRKRTAPNVDKAPATKKPKSAPTRRKSEPKARRQATPIPSVEELLQNIGSSKPSTTSSHLMVDTQELISHAESKIQSLRSTKEKDSELTPARATIQSVLQTDQEKASAPPKPTRKRTTSRRNPSQRPQAEASVTAVVPQNNQLSKQAPVQKTQDCEPTDSTTAIRASTCTETTKSQVKEVTEQAAAEPSAGARPEVDHPEPQSSRSLLPPSSLSSSNPKLPSKITSNPQLNKLFTQAITLEEMSPQTAVTDTRRTVQKQQQGTNNQAGSLSSDSTTELQPQRVPHSHSHSQSLSDAEMHQAIETFICQQIDNDEFLHLCKVMDTVSARVFVRY